MKFVPDIQHVCLDMTLLNQLQNAPKATHRKFWHELAYCRVQQRFSQNCSGRRSITDITYTAKVKKWRHYTPVHNFAQYWPFSKFFCQQI